MIDFKKWFAARARNPDKITLEEAFAADARAQPTLSVPEGWQLMPIEPTQEIRDAWTDNMYSSFRVAYQAMIAAAPKPEGE